ncbi:MAG: hypothetical protein FJW40_01405 [Acidobacteria bacterium]|nr:hypothetical protein [Acidobacteriota bacterium]
MSALLRGYCYLFNLALCLAALALGLVAYLSGVHNLNLGMLPWTGKNLTNYLIWLGLLGLMCVAGAFTGKVRFLLPLWCFAILCLFGWGFYLGSYSFPGREEFDQSLWFTGAALVSFLASLTLFKSGRRHHR